MLTKREDYAQQPRAIVSKLADTIGKVVVTPEMKARLKTLFIIPTVTAPDELR